MDTPEAIRRQPRAQRKYPQKFGHAATGGGLATSANNIPGKFSLNSRGAASGHNSSANIIDGSLQGGVSILDGEFNAVAGSHFTVQNLTINNSSESSLRFDKPRKPRNQGRRSKNGVQQSTNPDRDQALPHSELQLPSPSPSQGLSTFVRSPDFFAPRSCDIYYRHLAPLGRGFPLWIPAPDGNLATEHQRVGMQIGDVGIITANGGFDYQFNVCYPHGHHFNPEEMPEGFEPLILRTNDVRAYSSHGQGSSLASASVKKSFQRGESSFESSAQEGAILTMPDGSNTTELGNIKKFRDYAAQHAQSWYRYVNVMRGRNARNGDVRLVIGFDKTTTWGMASFSNPPGQQEPSVLRFWSAGEENHKLGNTYGWDYSGVHMAEVRSGPEAKEIENLRNGVTAPEGRYENQCLFIRTLNVRLQDYIWDDLQADFGTTVDDEDYSDQFYYGPSSSRPGSSGSDSSTGFSSGHSTTGSGYIGSARNFTIDPENEAPRDRLGANDGPLQQHPSTILNKMLLIENPQAKLAITNDHDWMCMITKDDVTLPSDMELYGRMKRYFSRSQQGDVAYLEGKDEPSAIYNEGISQHDSQLAGAEDFIVTDDENVFGFSPPETDDSAAYSTTYLQESVNDKPEVVIAYLRAQLSCKDSSTSILNKWAFSQYVRV